MKGRELKTGLIVVFFTHPRLIYHVVMCGICVAAIKCDPDDMTLYTDLMKHLDWINIKGMRKFGPDAWQKITIKTVLDMVA